MAWPASIPTFAPGPALVADLNDLRDALKAIGDPWASYTPTLINWGLGNGSLSGKWTQAGKLVHYRIDFTAGSSTTYVGNLRFTLPVACAHPTTLFPPVGAGVMLDTSATAKRYWHVCLVLSTHVSPVDDTGVGVNATIPWTWATGDSISISGTYEAS